MGVKLSKIDYSSITNLELLSDNTNINNTKSSKNKYIYKITYANGKTQKISLNYNKYITFNLRYKYNQKINPIKTINYLEINKIIPKFTSKLTVDKSLTNEESIISLKIIFNDKSEINKNYNYFEYIIFLSYLKFLRPTLHVELNKFFNM